MLETKHYKVQGIGANQYEIFFKKSNPILFQSYETVVAARLENLDYVQTEVKHSPTTSRHIKKWLDGVKAELKPQKFFNDLNDLLKK